MACFLPLLPLQATYHWDQQYPAGTLGCPACPSGTPRPQRQGSSSRSPTGQWCLCHIPFEVTAGEGKRGVQGYNTHIKKHSPSLSHWQLSYGFFPSLGSFPLFRGNCFVGFFFFFPKKQTSILTIYSDLQKQQSVLKRISNAELLLPVQVWHSPASKGTAQRAALVTSLLNWVSCGRKRQRKEGFCSAFGRGQKCNRSGEEPKQWRRTEQGKWNGDNSCNRLKILNLDAKY